MGLDDRGRIAKRCCNASLARVVEQDEGRAAVDHARCLPAHRRGFKAMRRFAFFPNNWKKVSFVREALESLWPRRWKSSKHGAVRRGRAVAKNGSKRNMPRAG